MAIAVALVPPLCVSGIGITLGSEMVAVVWARNSGGPHQSDRGGLISGFCGEPDRHHCHQPCGVFGAALRFNPQVLAQSFGLAWITRLAEHSAVIGLARLQRAVGDGCRVWSL